MMSISRSNLLLSLLLFLAFVTKFTETHNYEFKNKQQQGYSKYVIHVLLAVSAYSYWLGTSCCLGSYLSSTCIRLVSTSQELFQIVLLKVFVISWSKCAKNLEFKSESVVPIYSTRPDQVKKALKHVYTTTINKLGGKELEFLIAILPDNNGSLYGDKSGKDSNPSIDAVVDTPKLNIKEAMSSEHAFRGVKDCFSGTYRDAGIRGLYRGVAPSLYGIFPYSSLKFYFYEKMKSHVPVDYRKNMMVKLAYGSVAGLLCQTFTYPLDIVRRQIPMGTKLQHVIATLALESAANTGGFFAERLKPRDELFWFKKPEPLLNLIHFILFQNAFDWWIDSFLGLFCMKWLSGYIILDKVFPAHADQTSRRKLALFQVPLLLGIGEEDTALTKAT
ncbi:hypothetical protein Lser_V15G40165 [Lactuca serriola]